MEKLSVQDLAMFLGCEVEINGCVRGRMECILIGLVAVNTKSQYLQEHPSLVKPILRPLSDMTTEEMKELYFIVFKRQFIGNNITHRDIGKKEERRVLWSGLERLFIYSDGDIGADCDLNHYSVHHPTVVKWMLSKQFDVFGWIEKGLAISSTSKKVES